jgi:hypothetical protein
VQAPPRIPCLTGLGAGARAIALSQPAVCTLSLDGTEAPASAYVARLRALRWTVVTARQTVAVGAALPVHAPFNPYRVRVSFSRPVSGPCGAQFTRATVSSRFGARSGPLPTARCERGGRSATGPTRRALVGALARVLGDRAGCFARDTIRVSTDDPTWAAFWATTPTDSELAAVWAMAT